MLVQKRDNTFEDVSFDKVLNRIKNLSKNLNVQTVELAQKVCSRIYDKVKTSELDELAAYLCSSMIVEHPDYDILASRITISNHHKNTSPSFSETMSILYNNGDNPLISKDVYDVVQNHKEKLNSYIDYQRDYDFDYFGFKTLEKSYLMKKDGKIIERPQHMLMRVSIGIHLTDLKDALQTYDCMSKKLFTHASPTLFNSGTNRPQNSSCFLLANFDSIDGIFDTMKECALISKYAGGIGVHTHDVRAKNSKIRGTNGTSDGIIPMIRVFNNIARYINQCILPDKLVYTREGVKRMDEVTTNDYLVTHDGTFKKVNSIAINEKVDDEIMIIDVRHATHPLKCTKVHEIFVIDTKTHNFQSERLLKDLKKGVIKPEYVSADKVTKNHLMVFPIPSYEKDISYLSSEDMRFYGILIGDGSINVRNQWSININTTSKVKTGQYAKHYLERKNIHYWEYINENVHYITWTQNLAVPFKYEDLYDNNKEKRVNPQFMHLPKDKVRMMLKGLMETDGYSTSTGVYYGSTSLNVIQSMKYMLFRFGILGSVAIIDKVGQVMNVYKGKQIISRRINYELRLPKLQKLKDLDIYHNFKNSKFALFYQYDNLLFSKVTKVSKMKYTGKVYDFNMIDNHNYLTDSGLVHNSGRRQGSIAMYLEPWHGDIYGFLELKKPHGAEEERARDLFYALWIPDLFMERVKENGKWSLMCPDQCPGLSDAWGDKFNTLYKGYEEQGRFIKQVPAQELWFKILESQIETGTPYLCYKDAANKKSNQQNLGTIKSSNLCVAPETMILTDKGYYPIKSLCGKEVNVWNGKEFSKTIVHQTGRMQKLLTIKFSNGMTIKCTPYHKFLIERSKNPSKYSKVEIVEARNLDLGDPIVRYGLPTINSKGEELKYAYTHGLFCAEGTYAIHDTNDKHQCNYKKWNGTDFCKRHQNNVKLYDNKDKCCAESFTDKPMLWLYGKKKKLIDNVDWIYCNPDTTKDRLNIALPHDIKEKYYVPLNDNLNTKLRWLEGYFDGDGTISENNGAKNLQVSSSNKEFLKNVFYLLQTLGVNSVISVARKAGKMMMPDGKGRQKLYDTQTVYRINISCSNLLHLKEIGFSPKRLKVDDTTSKGGHTRFIKVIGIEDKGDYDDTYCFHEPKLQSGIFNGILTKNCSEIIEYTSKEEIAVCLTGDTEIVTDVGIRRLDDCDGYNVLSYYKTDTDLSIQESFVKAKLIDNGIKEVYEITLDGIKSIKATNNHKFLTSTHEWKQLNELRKGDELILPSFKPLNGFDNLDILNNYDQDFMNIGITAGLGFKFVPDYIKRANPKEIASFISGLFSNLSIILYDSITLINKYTTILEDVQMLLLCFGIRSKLETSENNFGNLVIKDLISMRRFADNINFGLNKDKVEKLTSLISDVVTEKTEEFVSILEIKYNGYHKVYDLSVPNTHHFIANGVITHNCNLASICLPSFYDNEKGTIDLNKLHDVSKIITKNLNKIIDVNFYPLEKARVSNLRHRPIGIGVQGLADLFAIMKLPFDSDKAKQINRDIFETIYHGALESSNDIATKRHLDREYIEKNMNEFDKPLLNSVYPGTYSSFEGSPASKGLLQFDLWDQHVDDSLWNWTDLKEKIKKYGIRNSLLLAPMPTASTSQICGFNESCEPFTSNLYKRKTMAGEFILVNKHLLKELVNLGLWNNEIKNAIIVNDGSIQNIPNIPQNVKDIFKTVWEIKQKHIIDMAATRGIFICQSQSMNLFVEAPDFKKLSSMHFYAWSSGLKTGIYYLRSKPRAKTQQFTIEPPSCQSCSA